jgi:hypothetical protein
MSHSTSPNDLNREELILLAEKRYAELLKADAEFKVLKPLRLQIKKLRNEKSIHQPDKVGGFR